MIRTLIVLAAWLTASAASAAPQPERAPSADAGLTPVPQTEVALWASGSIWCLNPSGEACDVLYYWRPDEQRRQVEIAAIALGQDENDGVLMVTAPWDLRDGRQCYQVRESDVSFAAVSPDGSPDEKAAGEIEREWRESLQTDAGQNHCVTFFRDAATGLVRQRRTIDGVEQPFEENEAFRVTVGGEGESRAI